jgi:3,4-dihydroxy 2-butanone 4-phosphate synthase/GTP cyclohydrolase II
MTTAFCTIDEALEELRTGRFVIVVDDERRENEGDLICAAELITPENVNFMLRHARGVLCLAVTREDCERLALTPQVSENTAPHGTAFMVSVDAAPRFSVTTGESAFDRALTIRRAVDPACRPTDLVRPGHVPPVRARSGGVLVRAGHTEAGVDLARLAGLRPNGVICPILNDDGEMARLPDLERFARRHNLKICTIADLIEYRQQREHLVERIETVQLPTVHGQFTLHEYRSLADPAPQLAICCGGIGERGPDGQCAPCDEPVLVRVHSECLTGDVFHSVRCDCGEQLHYALELIQRTGKGVLIYLRQEGRGIGLHNKLKAYKLQEGGLDTVEANEALGFPPDKRDYGIGAQILRDLGLRKLRVLTNNPKKVQRLEVYGLEIVEQIPIQMNASDANRRYLAAKKTKLGHMLDGI